MQRISNLEEIIPPLKLYLKKYLDAHGTRYRNNLFTCPNRAEHSNEDDTPSCGFIPETEDTIFHCFACLPGTELVRTEFGLKPIQEVTIGERVYTLTGELKTVVDQWKTDRNKKKIYSFRLANEYGFSSRFTEDHIMAVVRNLPEKVPYIQYDDHYFSGLKFYSCAKDRRRIGKYKDRLSVDFIEARYVKPGDYFILPQIRCKISPEYLVNTELKPYSSGPRNKRIERIPLSEDMMWLFGLFCAEGCATKNVIRFTLHSKEVTYAEKIKRILEETFQVKVTIRVYRNRINCAHVWCCSTDLSNLFRKLFGHLAENKRAPYEFVSYPLEYQKAFLQGVFDGDGSKGRYDCLQVTSRNLILTLQQVAVNLGIPYSLSYYPAYKAKYGSNCLESYSLRLLQGESLKCFYDKIGTKVYCFQRVDDIEVQPPEEVVYDLAIEGTGLDQSFLCRSYGVHNCQARGDIFSAYSLIEEKPIKGIAFHGAVKALCDQYGISYKQKDLSPEEDQFQTVQQTLSKILNYATKCLQSGEGVTEYLQKRGWSEIADHFQFGFLPDTPEVRQTLENLYTKIPYLEQYIKLSPFQLVDRLLYPIKDPYDVIVGFMDRKISEEDLREKYQKYFLKTLEKGEVLFNLQTCYPEIYLVEGGSSVFTMYKQGIKNVVSMLGKEFTENMYKALVKYGVKKVILCFDGDKQGLEGLKKTIGFFEKHPDIKTAVKLLTNDLDPDDFIRKEGIEAFKAIPEDSIFKYQLANFQETSDELEQDEYKRSLMEILSNTKDRIVANKMLDMLCRELNISKKLMLTELQQYEVTKGLGTAISVGSVIAEESHLFNQVEEFEQRALRAGRLQGPSWGFPIMDTKTDGMQDGLVLISGKWNVGKSAFMQSVALNLMQDPSNFVLYFSIDDSVIGKTIPRFLANMSTMPIGTIMNPIYGIDRDETMTSEQKQDLKMRRESAIAELKKYSGRLGIKDSVDGSDVKYIEKIIETYRAIAGDRKLIVFVDFLNMVALSRNVEKTEQESMLAGFFKHMSTKYSCPVVCTVESTKEILTTKTTENSIKGSSSLQFRSDLTLLLYSDFESPDDSNKMFFHDEDGIGQPIVKVRISKNKMGSFRGDIYYRFYKSLSKFEEIEEDQQTETARRCT